MSITDNDKNGFMNAIHGLDTSKGGSPLANAAGDN